MTSTKTAQVIIYCGLFLLVFLLSSFDLAVVMTISAYLLFTSKRYIPILSMSVALLLLDIFFQYFNISFRFIADLSLDAYILFLTAVFLYLKSQKRSAEFLKKIGLNGKKLLAKDILSALGISLVFSLLFLPLVGFHFSAILGYLSFSYITKQSEGKNAYTVALIFLIFSPFFIMAKKDNFAESFAIVSFYFLIIGTVQEIIKTIRSHTEKMAGDEIVEETRQEHIRKISFTLPGFNFPKINLRIVLPAFIILILLLLLYFLYPVISKSSSSFKMPIINFLKKAPTPTSLPMPTILPSPSIAPTPITQVSTSIALLKVMVFNGTEIFGLASTTSAKLKEVGFQNVVIGNAPKSDYKTWEILFKKNDEDIVGIIKNILGLDTLSAKEASVGAGYDIEIIAGEKR